MQPVELVEGGAPDTGAAAGTPSVPGAPRPSDGLPDGAQPHRGSRRGRGAGLLVLVALLVAGGLVVGQLVLVARDRARMAAWADLPGVVEPVGDEITVEWTMGRELAYSVVASSDATGRLVATPLADDGSADVVAVDVATGRELWRRQVLPADARRGAAAERYASPPMCRTDTGVTIVACLLSDGYDYTDADGALVRIPATWMRLAVLDVATGERLLDRAVLVMNALAVTATRVVLSGLDGAELVVRSLDALTGDEHWEHRHRLPYGDTPAPATDPYAFQMSVAAGGGVVGASDPYGEFTMLDLADGSVRWDYAGARHGNLDTDRPELGDAAVFTMGIGGNDLSVVLRPGAPDVQLRGYYLPISVDDGSVPGLALTTTGSGIVAWDLRTGTQRWTIPRYPNGETLVLGGVLYLSTGDSQVLALDAVDGSERWSVPLERGWRAPTTFTDGTYLYVVAERVDPENLRSRVGVFSFDGEPLGTLPLPDGITGVAGVGTAIVGWSDETDTLAVLR